MSSEFIPDQYVIVSEPKEHVVEQSDTEVVLVEDHSEALVEVSEVHLVFACDQGPPGPPGPVGIGGEEMPYSERTDFVGDDVIYRGYAEPGTLDSEPLWRIKKLVIGLDDDVATTWAGGTADFIHAWDDRTSYTYS